MSVNSVNSVNSTAGKKAGKSPGPWMRAAAARSLEAIGMVTEGILRRCPATPSLGFSEVPAMAAVILCYTCRRRVTQQEIAQGLHNHPHQQSE
ncbi:MAG: hypothetical protein AB7O65_10235 [Candidatus Korobacteraceae bacterium]